MIAVVAAPTNLGLRPPRPGSVPGCAKAPEALRDVGLHARLEALGAVDAGVVVPDRYVDDAASAVGRVRNQDAVVDHSRRLADRTAQLLSDGHSPLVLGGDCSLLMGTGLALARQRRHGLVHIDGHSDFRHPGNSDECLNLAGEDLAAAVGEHWPAVCDVERRGPYFEARHVAHIGCREDDEHLTEINETLGTVIPVQQVRERGVQVCAGSARRVAGSAPDPGYWLHLDVDALDPEYMPAVDSPARSGMDPGELTALLQALAPWAIGAQVTVFDPDLDPDQRCARLLTDILVTGLRGLSGGLPSV